MKNILSLLLALAVASTGVAQTRTVTAHPTTGAIAWPAANDFTASLSGPLYLGVAHVNLSGGARLAVTRSRDGITFERIGKTVPFIGDTGLRDPSVIYYAPTRQFVMTYTKAVDNTTFQTGIGVAVSTDLVTWTQLADITITGLTGTHSYSWNGSWLVDGGNYYLMLLPLGSGGNKNTHGVGWIRCTNPGTWTTWTSFTSLKATNSNWSAASDLNDPHVTKVGSTYHLFLDGDPGGGGAVGILHATSASPLTGYSALAAVSNHAAREGAILTTTPTGTYRLYSQATYGELKYATSADLSTWTSPAAINFAENFPIGNGEVLKVENLDAQAAVLAAPTGAPGPNNDALAYTSAITRWPLATNQLYVNTPTTGNGNTTGAGLVGTFSTSEVDWAVTNKFQQVSFFFGGLYMNCGVFTTPDNTFDLGYPGYQFRNVYVGTAVTYGSTGPKDMYGSGSPEGVATAPVGSTYRRTNGGAGTSFYVKESGSGNTGWVAK